MVIIIKPSSYVQPYSVISAETLSKLTDTISLVRLANLSKTSLSFLNRLFNGEIKYCKRSLLDRVISAINQIKEELYFSLLDRTDKDQLLETSNRRFLYNSNFQV